jgi:enoyl reductase-like protein
MTPSPGDFVYLADGSEVEYVMKLVDGGHLVYEIINYYNREIGCNVQERGLSKIVQSVYKDPVTTKFAESVQKLIDRKDQLTTELEKLTSDIRNLSDEKKFLEKTINQYPDIRTAVDFLEGKIKYGVLVCPYNSSKVVPFDEFLQSESSRGTRLISLFGVDSYTKKTTWRANRYTDGSGSWTHFYPFHTEIEAKSFLQEILDYNIKCCLSGVARNENKMNIEKTIDANDWLIVPIEWKNRIIQATLERKQKEVEDQKLKLQRVIEEVKKLESQCL